MLSAPMTVHLQPNVNQALGIGQFACDFMQNARPGALVEERTKLFHTDSVLCGISAVALGTNAPCLLREEALEYRRENGVPFFGSSVKVAPEKAIVANSSAVREWDSNGTNFGFRKELGFTAGEFGHNDFYPVAIAAAQMKGHDGAWALKGMMLSDEIRGRLAEVFSLKTYKIDHVVHGAIASAATWGAMMGATPEQIESAIGMVVAHYIPWRAIRAGKQLSDSKGASAAISTEVALVMSTQGDDFAVMGMHFKLGLYEHQSAGALQGMIDLMRKHPEILEKPETIKGIKIVAYEPAFGIIGDPAKRDPKTRQSADHSMVYIVGTLLRKAVEKAAEMKTGRIADGNDAMWKTLFLAPHDYDPAAIANTVTRAYMEKMAFEHGGPEYDRNYPDGIPTSVVITTTDGRSLDSGFVMYPSGHARNTTADLKGILANKFDRLGKLAMDDPKPLVEKLNALEKLDAKQLASLYDFRIADRGRFE
jgi:2-methylcitrate dehydratase